VVSQLQGAPQCSACRPCRCPGSPAATSGFPGVATTLCTCVCRAEDQGCGSPGWRRRAGGQRVPRYAGIPATAPAARGDAHAGGLGRALKGPRVQPHALAGWFATPLQAVPLTSRACRYGEGCASKRKLLPGASCFVTNLEVQHLNLGSQRCAPASCRFDQVLLCCL